MANNYKVSQIRKIALETFGKNHTINWLIKTIPPYAKLIKSSINKKGKYGCLIVDGGWSKSDLKKLKQNLKKLKN